MNRYLSQPPPPDPAEPTRPQGYIPAPDASPATVAIPVRRSATHDAPTKNAAGSGASDHGAASGPASSAAAYGAATAADQTAPGQAAPVLTAAAHSAESAPGTSKPASNPGAQLPAGMSTYVDGVSPSAAQTSSYDAMISTAATSSSYIDAAAHADGISMNGANASALAVQTSAHNVNANMHSAGTSANDANTATRGAGTSTNNANTAARSAGTSASDTNTAARSAGTNANDTSTAARSAGANANDANSAARGAGINASDTNTAVRDAETAASNAAKPASDTGSDAPASSPDAAAQPSSQPAPPAPAPNGYRVRARGRGLEKLLARLEKRGIHPQDIRREGLRAMSMQIKSRDLKVFDALCVELNIEVLERSPLGLTRTLRRLRRRAALPVCAALCAILIGLMSTRVWLVRVDAPAALTQQLNQALVELGVQPGAAKSALDLRAIEDALVAGVQGVKFCQARVRGVTLTLKAQQAQSAPDTLTLSPPGSLYARCDAVVERVQVLAGSAAVQRGDTVRAGDLLIAGVEQVSREGTAPVKAVGIVTGRIWYEGLGESALSETELVRTGAVATRRAIRLLDMEWVIEPAQAFDVCDRELSWQPIGGMFVPLGVMTERFFELTERQVERPLDEAQAIALDQARQNALKKCPDNATVIDKWAEYSIIEGNTIQARYVIEVEETIQCGG